MKFPLKRFQDRHTFNDFWIKIYVREPMGVHMKQHRVKDNVINTETVFMGDNLGSKSYLFLV